MRYTSFVRTRSRGRMTLIATLSHAVPDASKITRATAMPTRGPRIYPPARIVMRNVARTSGPIIRVKAVSRRQSPGCERADVVTEK